MCPLREISVELLERYQTQACFLLRLSIVEMDEQKQAKTAIVDLRQVPILSCRPTYYMYIQLYMYECSTSRIWLGNNNVDSLASHRSHQIRQCVLFIRCKEQLISLTIIWVDQSAKNQSFFGNLHVIHFIVAIVSSTTSVAL